MPAWRIWAEGRATLSELETSWSLEDVYDANDVLTMMDAQQAEQPKSGQAPEFGDQ